MSASPSFQEWMGQVQQHTESALEELLPEADLAPQRLHAAMRYAVLGGGQRVRPLRSPWHGSCSAMPAIRDVRG